MTYQVKFLSSFGLEQITDVYKNYRILQQGTATTGTVVNFPVQSIIPLILVRPPYGQAITASTNYWPGSTASITTSSFTASTFGDKWTGPAPINFDYQYVILVPTSTASPEQWAMRIRDASSQLLFDSGFSFPHFDNIVGATVNTNLTIAGWSGCTPLPFIGTYPYKCNIVQSLPTPSFGIRYLLLNQLKPIYEVLADDGADGTDVYNVGFYAILNSESSVTYRTDLIRAHAVGTPPGSVLYYYINNCTVPLLTSIVNI